METTTIILLTVLSTLSVVAVITMIAVAFSRLSRRVDELENSVFKCIEEREQEIRLIVTKLETDTDSCFVELERGIDSRLDKLDNKIKLLNNTANTTGTVVNAKQILKG